METNSTNVVRVIVRRDPDRDAAGMMLNDPITQLKQDLEICVGVHGPEALLLLLVCLCRYAGAACSAAVISPSCIGKTTLISRIVKFLPPEDYESLIEITYAALTSGGLWPSQVLRDGTHLVDLRDKLIVLDERADIGSGGRSVLAALRQATSAEETTRVKMENGVPARYRLLGPVSLIDCRLSTNDRDYQTANRMLPIALDDSTETLEALVRLTANKPTLKGRRMAQQRRDICTGWQSHLRSLARLGVVIDYADQLVLKIGRGVAGRVTHGPRLLTAVHSLISTVAWLRQGHKRRHQDPCGDGEIIFATRLDYRLAHSILSEAHILDESPLLSGPALNVLRKWQNLAEQNGNETTSAPTLYGKIGILVDRGNITRHLRELRESELAVELPQRNDNRQKMYKLTPHGECATTTRLLDALPVPDALEIENEAEFNANAEC